MAKKSRKPPAGRRTRPEPDGPDDEFVPIGDSAKAAEMLEAQEDDDEEAAPPARPALSPMSPLVRSQEIELEIGLTVLGAVMGALTGYGQNVPMDAPSGNVLGAIEAGAVGAMMGYSLGRTLFFSVRQQWTSWFVLVALALVGYLAAHLVGAVAGAAVGTGLVYMGVFGSEEDDVPTGERPPAA